MVKSMVRGDGQGVWTDCEMVISHSRYVVVKSCWSRDAGCLPGACGILGRRKNEVLPWASRHIDLICEVRIRCETSCMRCHGGRGLRSNNRWYLGNHHLIYSMIDIHRDSYDVKVKVYFTKLLRLKLRCFWHYTKLCVNDYHDVDWVKKLHCYIDQPILSLW